MKISPARYLVLAFGEIVLVLFSLSAVLGLYFGRTATPASAVVIVLLTITPVLLIGHVLRAWKARRPYAQAALASGLAAGVLWGISVAGIYLEPTLGWGLAVLLLAGSYKVAELVLTKP